MYEFDDEGESRRRWPLLLVAVALAAAGWFVVRPWATDDEASSAATTTTVSAATTEPPVETTAAPATTPTTAAPTVPDGPLYPTMPDGTPQPVIATFGVDTVTLDGQVPSQEALDKLAGLALANSRDPENTTLVNNLTINPFIPPSVGVRVIELTSTRFPEGSATVELAHAAEFNRIVAIMDLFPTITALVIGHSDQRGSEDSNLELSARRAAAVVDYIASQGIDRARLSSRAVGEADLLTLADDDTALELNRRTEFVIYGLLLV
ncbi:MAG: OmpA family protein [Desertimonas sp.]